MNVHGLFLYKRYLSTNIKFWGNRIFRHKNFRGNRIFFIYLSHFQLIKYIALKRTKLGNPSRFFRKKVVLLQA